MADPKEFSQHVLERLSRAVKDILHPFLYERTLREIGVSLGREAVSHVRSSQTTPRPFTQEDYHRCLGWMKTHWGWNHAVREDTKSLISISIPHCPFGTLAADDPHLCQIEAGMLGGIAGDHFDYAKVAICHSPDVPPKDCSITVHLQRTPQSLAVEGTSFPLAPQGRNKTRREVVEARMLDQLSPRERQVVRLVGEGFSDKVIASALKLSVRTVEGHLARIRQKTGLGSRGALIRWSIRINHDR